MWDSNTWEVENLEKKLENVHDTMNILQNATHIIRDAYGHH